MFERPGDELLTWYLDDHQTPEPVGPLTQSAYNYMFQEFRRAQRQLGREKPSSLRILFAGGYLYVHFTPPGGPLPEAGREALRLSPLRWEQEYLPEIKANLAQLNGIVLESLEDDELSHALQSAMKVLARHWAIHHSISFVAADQFAAWCKEHNLPADKLLGGQTNASIDSLHELWLLSRNVTVSELRSGELSESFRQELNRYLDLYGRRPAVYCDLTRPTWLENPAPVLKLILRYAEEGAADPYESVRKLAAEREALASRLDPQERERHELALRAVRMKEDHSFWIELQTTAAVRRVCMEFGRRIADVGILAEAGDVAFLTVPELLRFGFGIAQPHLGAAVPERKAEHEANRAFGPAPWLGAPPDDEEPGPAPGSECQGLAVSSGFHRGPARVLSSLAEAGELRRGEVLVAKDMDPTWTTLFPLAGALVTSVGGMLSHSAVVAREYGLPAVSGIPWGQIRTGQLVEVDGDAGIVRIV